MQLLFGRGCHADEGGWRWLAAKATFAVRAVPPGGVVLRARASTAEELLRARGVQEVSVFVDNQPHVDVTLRHARDEATLEVTIGGPRTAVVIDVISTRRFSPQGTRQVALYLHAIDLEGCEPVVTGGPLVPADEPCDVCGTFAPRRVTRPGRLGSDLTCCACGATACDRAVIAALGRVLDVPGPLAGWTPCADTAIVLRDPERPYSSRLARCFPTAGAARTVVIASGESPRTGLTERFSDAALVAPPDCVVLLPSTGLDSAPAGRAALLSQVAAFDFSPLVVDEGPRAWLLPTELTPVVVARRGDPACHRAVRVPEVTR